MREREGLIARIRHIRRVAAAAATRPSGAAGIDPALHPDALYLHALEIRIAHLEALVEGLQDSVHRESERQTRRISELEARTDPSALAVALDRDARERGL
jgi:hypothetical protein